MKPLKILASDLNLTCELICKTTDIWVSDTDDTHLKYEYGIKEAPKQVSSTVSFNITLTDGVKIKNANIFADVGMPYTPLFGAETSKINGVDVGVGETVSVPVEIEDGATAINIPFQFKCKTPSHTHSPSGFADYTYKDKNSGFYYHEYYFPHESVLSYSNIYLLIEYESAYTPPELIDYTDPNPVAGETYVKAVHMTELHTNVNLLRVAKKLEEYDFANIMALQTLLSNWNLCVIEIRTALDEISAEHEEWLVLGDNSPRLDVLLQLRRVVNELC